MRRKDPVNPAIYWLSFALQQVMVPAGIVLLARAIGQLIPIIENRFYGLNDPLKVVTYVLPDFLGFGLGLAVSRLPAAIREPARHIWIIPVVLFLALYSYSFVTDVRYLMAMLPIENGNVSDQFAILLFTFPCASCCLYSIAIRAGDREIQIDRAAARDYE
jgi:hypothetical protein